MKLALIFGLSGVAAFLFTQGSADSMLTKNTEELQKAATLNLTYTIQTVPDAAQDYKLELGKPGKFKLETPTEIVVADGTTVTTYKKSDNSYFQTAQTDNDIKMLLKRDAVWAWAAFFAKEPYKDLTGIKLGQKRVMKKSPVTEVSLNLPGKPERAGTLFIDQDLNVVRGMTIKKGDTDTIIWAKELKVSADAAPEADFAFTAPSGAKKVDPAAAASSIPFSKAEAVFAANCSGCHVGGGSFKARLNLGTYASAMQGGRSGPCIVAGDPDSSLLIQCMKGANGKPVMPPGGSIGANDIQTVYDWIKAGAKEN